MKRLDGRTVELTLAELAVVAYFEDRLSAGLGIQDAAWDALMPALPWVGREFVTYLSEGTLELAGGMILRIGAY